jgi:hypothetical protein
LDPLRRGQLEIREDPRNVVPVVDGRRGKDEFLAEEVEQVRQSLDRW